MGEDTEAAERLAALEVHVANLTKEQDSIKGDVSALKRFQITITAGIAAVGAMIAFFADSIRKKLGF